MINPLLLHRLSRWFYTRKVTKLPGLLTRINFFLTGCELPASVEIGEGTRFQHHGAGVIVHSLTKIGKNVLIHPQVVIGQNVRRDGIVPLERIVVGDNVQLGTGAKIIASGVLEIGDGAQIGANAVVLQSVPAGRTAVGIPARII